MCLFETKFQKYVIVNVHLIIVIVGPTANQPKQNNFQFTYQFQLSRADLVHF